MAINVRHAAWGSCDGNVVERFDVRNEGSVGRPGHAVVVVLPSVTPALPRAPGTVITHGRSSFPYLAVAREHDVAYADVLLLSDRLEESGRPDGGISPSSPAWAHATLYGPRSAIGVHVAGLIAGIAGLIH
ncbi:hypothetical protein [Bradyrhizobium japonicum]|uniref:hypothetical protein n=1 Tax=Bradyrhizobium japonicum TaxID=375 RepID=UPI0027151EFE|nr:hypothetical protein [Bradyrhizobium japonicum]